MAHLVGWLSSVKRLMLGLYSSLPGGVTNGTEMDWGMGWRELKVEERDKGVKII